MLIKKGYPGLFRVGIFFVLSLWIINEFEKNHLLTEFEARTVSYGPSFFPFDLWPKREARGP